jgi:hypothetical protein
MIGPMKQRLKNLLKEVEFRWEYYVMYFFFHPHKRSVYHILMRRKWGDKYCTKKELEDYLTSVDPGES